MGLKDYQEQICLKKKILHAVISIYHQDLQAEKSFVNEQLAMLQENLRAESKNYESVRVSFVYETPALDVKIVEDMKKDVSRFYKEPYSKRSGMHRLSDIWFMSLILLEDFSKSQKHHVENRLYMITDEKFQRTDVNEIIAEENGQIVIHPRFSDISFKPYLIKTKNAGDGLLEKYFSINGSVKVV